MRRSNIGIVAAMMVAAVAVSPAEAAGRLSDEEISQSYIYLLGRLLVTRQQQLDFQDGFKWNHIVHRQPGKVDWPNPNLDVAYSEAWLAVDETSCTIASVPEIKGRYFTVQILNGWGETLANINERVLPNKFSGDFAICLRGAKVNLPEIITARIDIPIKQARVLVRVALGDDLDKAVEYQHQFTFKATGSPKLPDLPNTPIFELESLPGVEAFEAAGAALDSEPDANPGLEPLAEHARAIGESVKDPAEHARIDKIIHTRGMADFAKGCLQYRLPRSYSDRLRWHLGKYRALAADAEGTGLSPDLPVLRADRRRLQWHVLAARAH
jgi:hypothetical protein